MTASSRKYRILVVDDDPSVLTTYRMILEQKGYEVVPAPSAQEARRLLEAERLDLLLCDLSLEEGESGLTVIECARGRHPGLPALLLTGYASKDISDRAQRLGVSTLFKPVEIQEFLAVIRAHLSAHEHKAASGE
jgi:DNA-binding NtrC family response regulator